MVTPPPATEAATSLICGGVESYLSASVADASLPAWSVQVPVIVAAVVSGPAKRTGAVHEPTPDVASVPANVTETGWLYQPLFVGALPGEAVTVGGVAAYFIATDPGPLTLPGLSPHAPVAAPAAASGPRH